MANKCFLQYVENADFVIPVTIEDVIHNVYVIKRPGTAQTISTHHNHLKSKKLHGLLLIALMFQEWTNL